MAANSEIDTNHWMVGPYTALCNKYRYPPRVWVQELLGQVPQSVRKIRLRLVPPEGNDHESALDFEECDLILSMLLAKTEPCGVVFRSLDLSGTESDNYIIRNICRYFTKMDNRGCRLQDLILDNCCMSTHGRNDVMVFIALCRPLKVSLRRLVLSGNREFTSINPVSWKRILQEGKLKLLDMRDTGLTDKSIRELCAVLSSSAEHLLVLKLGPPAYASQISDGVLEALKHLVAKCRSLEVLEIKGICGDHRTELAWTERSHLSQEWSSVKGGLHRSIASQESFRLSIVRPTPKMEEFLLEGVKFKVCIPRTTGRKRERTPSGESLEGGPVRAPRNQLRHPPAYATRYVKHRAPHTQGQPLQRRKAAGFGRSNRVRGGANYCRRTGPPCQWKNTAATQKNRQPGNRPDKGPKVFFPPDEMGGEGTGVGACPVDEDAMSHVVDQPVQASAAGASTNRGAMAGPSRRAQLDTVCGDLDQSFGASVDAPRLEKVRGSGVAGPSSHGIKLDRFNDFLDQSIRAAGSIHPPNNFSNDSTGLVPSWAMDVDGAYFFGANQDHNKGRGHGPSRRRRRVMEYDSATTDSMVGDEDAVVQDVIDLHLDITSSPGKAKKKKPRRKLKQIFFKRGRGSSDNVSEQDAASSGGSGGGGERQQQGRKKRKANRDGNGLTLDSPIRQGENEVFDPELEKMYGAPPGGRVVQLDGGNGNDDMDLQGYFSDGFIRPDEEIVYTTSATDGSIEQDLDALNLQAREAEIHEPPPPSPAWSSSSDDPIDEPKPPSPPPSSAPDDPIDDPEVPSPPPSSAPDNPIDEPKPLSPPPSSAPDDPIDEPKPPSPPQSSTADDPIDDPKLPSPPHRSAPDDSIDDPVNLEDLSTTKPGDTSDQREHLERDGLVNGNDEGAVAPGAESETGAADAGTGEADVDTGTAGGTGGPTGNKKSKEALEVARELATLQPFYYDRFREKHKPGKIFADQGRYGLRPRRGTNHRSLAISDDDEKSEAHSSTSNSDPNTSQQQDEVEEGNDGAKEVNRQQDACASKPEPEAAPELGRPGVGPNILGNQIQSMSPINSDGPQAKKHADPVPDRIQSQQVDLSEHNEPPCAIPNPDAGTSGAGLEPMSTLNDGTPRPKSGPEPACATDGTPGAPLPPKPMSEADDGTPVLGKVPEPLSQVNSGTPRPRSDPEPACVTDGTPGAPSPPKPMSEADDRTPVLGKVPEPLSQVNSGTPRPRSGPEPTCVTDGTPGAPSHPKPMSEADDRTPVLGKIPEPLSQANCATPRPRSGANEGVQGVSAPQVDDKTPGAGPGLVETRCLPQVVDRTPGARPGPNEILSSPRDGDGTPGVGPGTNEMLPSPQTGAGTPGVGPGLNEMLPSPQTGAGTPGVGRFMSQLSTMAQVHGAHAQHGSQAVAIVPESSDEDLVDDATY